MALPPRFKGHRLTVTDASSASASKEPLHTLEFYLDYVCPFSASTAQTYLPPPPPNHLVPSAPCVTGFLPRCNPTN